MCICLRSSSNDQPSLALSVLTHQCCFKCLLPWKQAARVKVLYPSFIQFSLLPFPSLCYLSILCCFVPSFSSVSVTPSSRRSPPPLPLLFSFSVTFLPLSIHSRQPRCHALTSLSLPLLSSFSPLVTSFSSSLFPFIHRRFYLSFIPFNSHHLSLFSIGNSLEFFMFPHKHIHSSMQSEHQ